MIGERGVDRGAIEAVLGGLSACVSCISARSKSRSLDETVEAVDLGQSPAEVVFLSFTDSDLAALARAYEDARAAAEPAARQSRGAEAPLSRSISISRMLCARARFVLVRLLGGMDYWRYGVDELAALAARSGVQARASCRAIARGRRPRRGLDAGAAALRVLWSYFEEGGPDNMAACLAFIAAEIGARGRAPPPPAPVSAFGRFDRRRCLGANRARRARSSSSTARSISPTISRRSTRCAGALDARGFAVTSVLCHQPQGRRGARRLRALSRADRRFDVIAQRHRLFRAARRRRGRRSRRRRRARPAGRARAASSATHGRASTRGLGAGRSRDARRAARDRRAHPRRARFPSRRRAARDDRHWSSRGRPPAARRPRRLCRRSRLPPGRVSPQAARRTAPRLRPLRLSRQAAAASATPSGSIRPRASSRSASAARRRL